mmetsp:Transcript_76609/g.212852  ORF Transcript_76609/g.212852 Transcript_76609/m.212852 type:complete len:307 (+) Transcript_76609:708-1628(+)
MRPRRGARSVCKRWRRRQRRGARRRPRSACKRRRRRGTWSVCTRRRRRPRHESLSRPKLLLPVLFESVCAIYVRDANVRKPPQEVLPCHEEHAVHPIPISDAELGFELGELRPARPIVAKGARPLRKRVGPPRVSDLHNFPLAAIRQVGMSCDERVRVVFHDAVRANRLSRGAITSHGGWILHGPCHHYAVLFVRPLELFEKLIGNDLHDERLSVASSVSRIHEVGKLSIPTLLVVRREATDDASALAERPENVALAQHHQNRQGDASVQLGVTAEPFRASLFKQEDPQLVVPRLARQGLRLATIG